MQLQDEEHLLGMGSGMQTPGAFRAALPPHLSAGTVGDLGRPLAPTGIFLQVAGQTSWKQTRGAAPHSQKVPGLGKHLVSLLRGSVSVAFTASTPLAHDGAGAPGGAKSIW